MKIIYSFNSFIEDNYVQVHEVCMKIQGYIVHSIYNYKSNLLLE